MSKDPANGRCDIPGRQRRGCDLVQQGLKQMVVLTVDERNTRRSAGKTARDGEPAESTAEDDDVRLRHRHMLLARPTHVRRGQMNG